SEFLAPTGLRPCVHEQRLELFHCRAPDLDVSVAPAIFEAALRSRLRARGARVSAVDIDPAGESDLAVDDDDLARIAVLKIPGLGRLERIQRAEFADFDAMGTHAVEKLPWRIAAADGVVEHPHLDAFAALLREQIGEAVSDLTGAEDERFDMNVVASLA